MRRVVSTIVFCGVTFLGLNLCVTKASAEDLLRISSSAQVYQAYAEEAVAAFQKQKGVRVDVHVSSSESSLGRLMNGIADLATTVEGFSFRYGDYGYLQIPFCKDPLVVIAHPDVGVDNITQEQVEGVFGGHITNWKELGGPDQPIILVVPGKDTAAYKNFERQAMKRRNIIYDFMSYRSTMAVRAVRRVPFTISFIGQGVIAGQAGVKTIKIDGKVPGDSNYPFHQVFSFAVEGNPVGLAEAFIDFTFSDQGQAILRKKGMVPVPAED